MTLIPDKNVLKLWRLSAAVISAAVFSVICYIPFIGGAVKLLAAVITAALLCAAVFIYLPRLFKAQRITVSDGRLCCRKGFIIKREYVYPNKNIVYIQYFSLPVHSCFGLFVAVVKGVGNSLVLPPLTAEQVILLKEAVKSE